jgi:hypothetical protein
MAGVSFEYIDGEGGTFALATASPHKRKLMGFGGVGMVAPEHFWQALPDQDGAEHLGYRVPRRTMNFVCKSAGTSRADIWEEKRDWAEAFSLDKGQGRIRATLPDGSIFQIYCRYAGGLDFSTEDSEIPTVQGFPVQLVSDSPYWESESLSTATTNFNGTATVALTCTVAGDVPTYPTFRVSPTVEHPVIALSGVGTIDVDVTVGSGGGTLVINCETPSVVHFVTDTMGSATTASNFFELSRGSNTVNLTATSGSGAIKAEWTEKHIALKP